MLPKNLRLPIELRSRPAFAPNSKSEYRISKQIRINETQNSKRTRSFLNIRFFEFVSDFEFRISGREEVGDKAIYGGNIR